MARVNKVSRRSESRSLRRRTPIALRAVKDVGAKKKSAKILKKKKDWEDATCSVCMESPHNAVLLLCSSYDKGCRPYMCATDQRFSNCLEQYQKAYTKASAIQNSQRDRLVANLGSNSSERGPIEKGEKPELLCPLCRGHVKGCTVVEQARKYLNVKKRACLQDKCSFSGTYKELKKHVKSKHPLSRPRAVDPVLQEKWKRLEGERERNDVISTIMSSTPGAVVLGDYVLEPHHGGVYSDSDSELDDYIDDLGFGSFVGLSGALFNATSLSSAGARHSFPRNRAIFGRPRRQHRIREDRGRSM